MRWMLCITFFILVFENAHALQGQWHEARTPNFIIISDLEPSVLKKRAVELEKANIVISRYLNIDHNVKRVPVTIYLFKSLRALEQYYGSGENTVGAYKSSAFQPIIMSYVGQVDDGKYRFTPEELMMQSLAFHLMTFHTEDTSIWRAAPMWIKSGLASVLSSMHFEDGNAIIGSRIRTYNSRLRHMIRYSRLVRWHHVLLDAPKFPDTHRRFDYSVQSWIAMHYILLQDDVKAMDMVLSYLSNLSNGMENEQAFHQAFGVSPKKMGVKINNYFRKSRLAKTTLTVPIDDLQADINVRSLSAKQAEAKLSYMAKIFAE